MAGSVYASEVGAICTHNLSEFVSGASRPRSSTWIGGTDEELDGFDGRVALVTGAARGIGREIAATLSRLGARVAGGDLEPPVDERFWA